MKKILIANRGEIAIRIMRTAHILGIETVAVYSDADRAALHTQFADEATYIGETAPSTSYLNIENILKAAKDSGADAIHPGYGFLSENATFAREVEKAGLVFIGPEAKTIETMGDKLAAKSAVRAYGIPMVPGIDHAVADIEEAKKIARDIGFPILVKAAAGGGGKGMRIVGAEADLEEQLKRAVSEAKSAFGDGSVFIEKYITSPRHIEIQIMADRHGNYIHLFERECSVQRRHQKVVEEAPSAVLDSELRNAMGRAAVNVAKACNYVGAGTVEFLLDENRNFYFLEMNTRLQVEHPVTEFITALDLVAMQIAIAKGEKLPIAQEDLSFKGHAIELRVYAEDPFDNFLPSIGKLSTYQIPKGANIRVDNGVYKGQEIPVQYDPLLSKLITYGENRSAAIRTMLKAIEQYEIKGLKTTLPFGKFVMEHPDFVAGTFDTHFVKKHFTAKAIENKQKTDAEIAAKIALYHYLEKRRILKLPKD